MKAKLYLRVSKNKRGGYKAAVTTHRPSYKPLTEGTGWRERDAPTAAFAIVLDIPDEVFNRAAQVLAEVELGDGDVQIAAEGASLPSPETVSA